jgi:DNA repair exonuclease SbcCD ATPase subunit
MYGTFITKRNDLSLQRATVQSELNRLNDSLKTLQSFINTETNENLVRENASLAKSIENKDKAEAQVGILVKWCEENKPADSDSSKDKRPVQAIQTEINNLLGQIQANIQQEKTNARLRKERDEDKKQIENLTISLNDAQIRLNDLDTVKKILVTDFPSFVNVKACGILEEYMNSFFASTKDKFEIKLEQDKKGVGFFYKADGEPEWDTVKMTSGFEESLLNVGFRSSVAKAYNSPILILDEPFKFVSAGNLARVRQLLESLSEEMNIQILMVTHLDELKIGKVIEL